MNRRTTLLALGGAALPLVLRPTLVRAQTDISIPDYTTMTLSYGQLAKDTSKVALKSSTASANVQEFAKGEILEQTAIAQSLTDDFTPPPAPLTPQQQATLAAVEAAAGTPQFDAVYVSAQISGHHSLLALQDKLLRTDTDPSDDTVHVALIARAFIRNHLAILAMLQSQG
jgi:predicted outer membrane protein